MNDQTRAMVKAMNDQLAKAINDLSNAHAKAMKDQNNALADVIRKQNAALDTQTHVVAKAINDQSNALAKAINDQNNALVNLIPTPSANDLVVAAITNLQDAIAGRYGGPLKKPKPNTVIDTLTKIEEALYTKDKAIKLSDTLNMEDDFTYKTKRAVLRTQ